MALQKMAMAKHRSASKRLATSRKKRKFNKRSCSRSATLDSLASLDSRTSDLNDEHEGRMNTDTTGFDRGGEQSIAESREAQVIPFHYVDEWALFILLEERFGTDKFRIEQTYEAFNVWAPGDLGEEDIESCRF